MSGRDHHEKPYDGSTQAKLSLYRGYLHEWLPVFLNQPNFSTINIFDFFAGPGSDPEKKPGSPVIAFEEICNAIKNHKSEHMPKIHLYLNELDTKKYSVLAEWEQQQPRQYECVNIHTEQMDFHKVFPKWTTIAKKQRTANMLFLDQYGVKYVNAEVFKTILQLPVTDFLFFIASSMINRFKEEDSIQRCVPVTDDDLMRMNNTNVHRIVTEAYRRLIPSGEEYYLAPFSIKKGGNIYGLIFGSHHPYGMEKFLRKCWNNDKLRGEANFDIDEEGISPLTPSLFPEMDKPKKMNQFERELISAISARQVKTNDDIFIFSLRRGFLGSHAKKVMAGMIEANQLPKQPLHISYEAWKKREPEPIKYSDEEQP